MHSFKTFICGALALANSALATPTHLDERYDPNLPGYLGVFFLGDEPSVYFYTSLNDAPTAFTALNGGAPVIVPTLGTKGVRDPSIIVGQGSSAGKYFVIGTDLDIATTTWDASTRLGSRSIFIWESTDLVTWTGERLPIVEDETAGMVWAPDAIWDPDQGQFLVHWASRFYDAADTAHSGTPSSDLIRYSYTSDFITFTDPATWFDGGGIIDMNVLPLADNSYARFYKNETAVLVYQQTSYDGLFGTWLDAHPVNYDNTEGPASFWDNAVDSKAHVLLDYFTEGSGGYKAFSTIDSAGGVEGGVWTADSTALSPFGLRHGSVMSLTTSQLDALNAAYS